MKRCCLRTYALTHPHVSHTHCRGRWWPTTPWMARQTGRPSTPPAPTTARSATWRPSTRRRTRGWPCPRTRWARGCTHAALHQSSCPSQPQESTECTVTIPSQEFPNGGITNGAAWYPIYGSMQDWVYLATGCFELTVEVSESKWPPMASLGALWKENKASLLGLPLLAVLGGCVRFGGVGQRGLACTRVWSRGCHPGAAAAAQFGIVAAASAQEQRVTASMLVVFLDLTLKTS